MRFQNILAIAVSFVVQSTALAEEISIFGTDTLNLPHDVIFRWVYPPDAPPEEQTYNFSWTGLTAEDRRRAGELCCSFEDMDEGYRGYIKLWQFQIPAQFLELTPYDMHILNCEAFRQRWGYGFRSFDYKTSIGHCANPFGALIYHVCKYKEKRVICGYGLNYVEIYVVEDTDPYGFGAAYDAYKERPSHAYRPEDILQALRIPAAVDLVEEMISRVRPAND